MTETLYTGEPGVLGVGLIEVSRSGKLMGIGAWPLSNELYATVKCTLFENKTWLLLYS